MKVDMSIEKYLKTCRLEVENMTLVRENQRLVELLVNTVNMAQCDNPRDYDEYSWKQHLIAETGIRDKEIERWL